MQLAIDEHPDKNDGFAPPVKSEQRPRAPSSVSREKSCATKNDSLGNDLYAPSEQIDGSRSEKQETPAVMSPSTIARTQSKCSICQKRKAAEGCVSQSCLSCCTDINCALHKRSREQAAWKAQVLDRATPVQLRAAELRARRITNRKGFLKEPGFVYTGDTIMIWNVHEYLANTKWKDDAVRKCLRRQERNEFQRGNVRRLGNSRRRFQQFIEQRLQESLNKGSMGP